VWAADFEVPACKKFFLPMPAKKKISKSAAARWCFKVCSPYCICSSECLTGLKDLTFNQIELVEQKLPQQWHFEEHK
jgi:hypothetical protein